MEIKADIASEVIAFIREETGFKTIVCDTSGTIIAAAETSRIGNIHSGSRRMMRENLSEVVISREEEELSGRLVREGVNLPIIYDGQVLGTYGIGGEPTIVRPVAKIAAGLIRNAIQDEETRKIIIEQSKRLRASNTTSATTDEDQPVLTAANHDLLLVLSEQVSMSIERNRLESDLNEKLYLTSRTDVLTGL